MRNPTIPGLAKNPDASNRPERLSNDNSPCERIWQGSNPNDCQSRLLIAQYAFQVKSPELLNCVQPVSGFPGFTSDAEKNLYEAEICCRLW